MDGGRGAGSRSGSLVSTKEPDPDSDPESAQPPSSATRRAAKRMRGGRSMGFLLGVGGSWLERLVV